MGMTMIDKILARKSGRDTVRPGDIVVCDVDMAVQLDLIWTVAGHTYPPKRIANPDRVAVVLDHTIPAPTVHDASGHARARAFAEEWGIENFYDVGRHGICHQVILENGLALPGTVLACTDSHTIASGVFNCAARGLGPIEMLSIVCTGKTWYKSSPTIRYELVGTKPASVFGKDVFLHIAGVHGSHEGHNVEFGGPGLESLTLDDRATLATMCAEISANFATFPADRLVIDHLHDITDRPFEPVESDPDADYADLRTIDLDRLVAHVARPDFVPGNTLPVRELPETPIQQAFVGSCANGKLNDIRIAAQVLEGRQVKKGVRLLVTPASQQVYLEAVRAGYVEKLVQAGAVVTNSTCGACYGGHMGVLAPDETCITSSTRNFKGRMGSSDARIYIGSSATVAASAVEGHIVDPSPYLQEAVHA
ncbi:MAG: 3-isopropylmalate dehydratase large subunit [bacterium]|jgi:3-isopropylmalate/(R)-2-methylmalate dehydratase large subunit|nr:3-isopropylmalate dehydratase large subunit [bacterium]